MPLTWYEFVRLWKDSQLAERSAYQKHFNGICEILGQPTPAASDPIGDTYTFDKHVAKNLGGTGYADVWKRGHFAWEYKRNHSSLTAAYKQLLDYRENLENPPLLVVSDLERFDVHTNWTNTAKRVYKFTLQDLLKHEQTPTCPLPPSDVLKFLLTDPEQLRPDKVAEKVTRDAAKEFAAIAERLELEGPHRLTAEGKEEVARFLMRLLFCLFADSIGLLPDSIFRKMIDESRGRGKSFTPKLRGLFRSMSEKGELFGPYEIQWFNGGLFNGEEPLELSTPDLANLYKASRMDWSAVEPAIIGTLFERSLDKGKRKLIGAHYTSAADIRLVIEPVIVAPLRRRWQIVKAQLEMLSKEAVDKNGKGAKAVREKMQDKLVAWVTELSNVKVLDPACGSGNFLYVSLRALLDLWLEARQFGIEHHLPSILPETVSPRQLYGIETDFYAHELASAAVWIGYLQWRHEHSLGVPSEPVLEKLTNIEQGDAVLRYDEKGRPYEPEWPVVDFIVSNPPFLGGKRLRTELGDKCVDDLFKVYGGRVAAESDLVVYWFEKARAELEAGGVSRVGLLGTQGIRGGANRQVLERINGSAHIFMAWSDLPWLLDGAAVRISIIAFENFDSDNKTPPMLDGSPVPAIHPDLTSGANTTRAHLLPENAGICFMGTTKVGAFDIEPEVARKMLAAPLNPNGRPNSDVVRPWVNAMDITRRPRGMFIIDFGTEMSEAEAALYEMPFEYVRAHVRPLRKKNKRDGYRMKWWLHGEPRPDLRAALAPLERYVITPGVSKHRLFAWESVEVLPDHAAFVFARDDDYFFGVLHSRLHEVWALVMGTQLEDRPRYTPTSTFETFPFPWPADRQMKRNPQATAIGASAKELVQRRDAWLNPPNAEPEELARRTLTNLYNERPAWLDQAHAKLDAAVFAAYGWPTTLSDAEILERLLALNRERAAAESNEFE